MASVVRRTRGGPVMFCNEVESRPGIGGAIASLTRQSFSPAQADSFGRFRLGLAHGPIRAWHTTTLVLALMAVAIDPLLRRLGSPIIPMPWESVHPVVVACVIMALLARSLLCAAAWSRSFERLYPRVALQLVLVAHGCGAVALSNAVRGSHMGFVAVAAAYVFGAAILSGLSFRQSQYVNAACLAGFLFGVWLLGVPVAAVMAVLTALLLCGVMAGTAALALENSRRTLFIEHHRVSDLAVLDGLTGLNNRYAFDDYLPRAWKAALQDRRTLALLLIDVDFFKTYNDTRGHVAGDQALQSIATAIRGMARQSSGFVARYGGDEIVVVLPDATAECAAAFASRLHDAVSDLGLTWHESGRIRRMTVSTGVAHLRPATGSTSRQALQVADQALYAAKRAGRNRFALLQGEAAVSSVA